MSKKKKVHHKKHNKHFLFTHVPTHYGLAILLVAMFLAVYSISSMVQSYSAFA